MKKLLIALAGTGILAAGIATAAAPEAARAWGGRGAGGPLAHFCGESRDARLAGMLAYAETRLGITDEQRGAWETFEQEVRTSTGPMDRLCEQIGTAERPSTLPERMARFEQVAEAGLAQLREIRPAVETMYAALTPEQQKTADKMMRRGPRGHHRH